MESTKIGIIQVENANSDLQKVGREVGIEYWSTVGL